MKSLYHNCQICNKKFSNTGNLNKHCKQKHGEIQSAICKCGKTFESSQSMNAHWRHCLIHRNGNPSIPPGTKGKPSKHKGLKFEDYLSNPVATKLKISNANIGKSHQHTEASKEKMSIARIKTLENSPHIKWFTVDNIKVQGTWEKFIAEKCVEAGLKLARIKLPFDNHRHYTPDIYLPDLDIYLEIKGWLSDRDKKKYQKVMSEHSNKTIKIIHGKKAVFEFTTKEIQNLPNMIDLLVP